MQDFNLDFEIEKKPELKSSRPGDWLENSPILTILVVAIGVGWMILEFTQQNPILAISSLNTYNFVFLMLGLALHGTPRNFLNAVSKAVPAVSGVLIQFPLYGSIAFIMTHAMNSNDLSLSHYIAEFLFLLLPRKVLL